MGITELWLKDVKAKLWPLSVTDLYGVGKQTGVRLNNIGVRTIGDLAAYNPRALTQMLGKHGSELQRMANGIDYSAVTPHVSGEMKSIGRSTTLAEDATDVEKIRNVFLEMCEEIGFDARKHNKKAKTLQITIKYSDFNTITRQTAIVPTFLTKDIYEKGFALLKKSWNSIKPVRLIGVSISGFEADCLSGQMSLFDQES
jgi:DNA polymerase-4